MISLNKDINQVDFDAFVDMLYDAGWRNTCDAQHSLIESLYNDLLILKYSPVNIKIGGYPMGVEHKHLMYLDDIYSTGKSTSYIDLQAKFGVTISVAKTIVEYWDDTFTERRK